MILVTRYEGCISHDLLKKYYFYVKTCLYYLDT